MVFAAIISVTMFVTYLAAKRVKTAADFYAAGGGEVCCTMVAGKVLYRDGAFPGLDYPGLLAAFHEASAKVTGRAS